MLPLEQRNMYSDPYRGSYHLRCLTEAEILSSSHYHRMTSAQRHGSNYIIQAHNTLAARQHQSSSTLSLLPPFFFLVSAFFFHFLHLHCSSFSILLFLPRLLPPTFICPLHQFQHRQAPSLTHLTISSEGGALQN